MCRALSYVHALPYHAVDKIQWKPNWIPTPEPDFTNAQEALLSQERWLIDGYGSWASVMRHINAADTIIFVDHPIRVTSGGRPSDRSSPSSSDDPTGRRAVYVPGDDPPL
jgi:hypothetical protein